MECKSNNNPLVSVIIPTYKRSNMLSKCIDTVLSQTYDNIEIIVVDDNNPDTEWRVQTAVTMREYLHNEKVKYIQHKANKNGSAARNTGLQYSSGDYICFLDDDDFFLPEKTRKQVLYLQNNLHVDACFCDYEKEGQSYILTEKDDFSADILLSNNTPQTSGIMFRRKVICALQGFDETYIRHQDYELLLRFFYAGYRLGKVDEVLYIRERAKNSNLPDGKKMEYVKCRFLNQFEPVISRLAETNKNFRKKVVVANYFTVMKCYIRDGKPKEAARIAKFCVKTDFILFFFEGISAVYDSIRYRYLKMKSERST